MQFFDTTPLGRIVNRFAKDIDVIDIMIPMQVGMFLICLMSVLSTIVVVSISTPLFMTVIFPLGVLYFLLQVNVAWSVGSPAFVFLCMSIVVDVSPSLEFSSFVIWPS